MGERWILASASPRRIELLRAAGMEVEVIPSGVEELHDESWDYRQLCEENARRKARDVAARHAGGWVIAADTLVCLEGRPLGKPADGGEARRMLQALSGKVNQVCTGVWVVDPQGGEHGFCEVSEVVFRELEDRVIDEYLAKVYTLDKAGGYAVQERGDLIIAEVRGDLDNVIGLPVTRLRAMLCELGVDF
jgi:septum formation protein